MRYVVPQVTKLFVQMSCRGGDASASFVSARSELLLLFQVAAPEINSAVAHPNAYCYFCTYARPRGDEHVNGACHPTQINLILLDVVPVPFVLFRIVLIPWWHIRVEAMR